MLNVPNDKGQAAEVLFFYCCYASMAGRCHDGNGDRGDKRGREGGFSRRWFVRTPSLFLYGEETVAVKALEAIRKPQ